MDLVEIRKKAKARKEAEAAKARSGSGAEGPAKHEEPDNKDGQAGISVPAEAAPPAAVEQPALEAHEAPVDGAEYLAFMLSDEEYALRIDDVREIIRPRAITAVPRAPGFVMGVISLRGAVMPVFDIKKRLGLGEAEVSRPSRILVVSDKGSEQGIMVDRVTGVVRLGPDDIGPPPSVIGGVGAGYLEGVGRLGDRLLILFDTQKVLSMDEQ